MTKNIKPFKFIDLFAGIGGFHLAMHDLGGECVFSSEIDEHARKTYEHNFKKISPNLFKKELFNSDIRSIVPDDIPDFDVLCAGFPCQPFSQAGHKRGFNDSHKSERGNLFFNIVDILETKKPSAFFLENVRGIINHDNGKTFKTIRGILEDELGYSFYFKVVKATDYGLPQHRPRTFMIGFKNDDHLKGFKFPPSVPLKFTMSDVWKGNCSREIGFTLRVGGRGSNINDRRNWDSYLVDDVVKKIMPEQAKKMQGFPETFNLPVSSTQAMKQLGNSVAVDAIYACGKELLLYKDSLKKNMTNKKIKRTKNKGEWTEFLTFIKLLHDRKITLSDKDLENTEDFFNVSKVTTKNIDYECDIKQKDIINIISKSNSSTVTTINSIDLINSKTIDVIINKIKEGSSTFYIDELSQIESNLGFTMVKGGTSSQKADIVLDIANNQISKQNEGFGIKSYLGSKPTLLNASSNTNFIFKIEGLSPSLIDNINNIDTRTKLKDRINKIYDHGGSLNFHRPEKSTMEYNLKAVDSCMPEIIGAMLHEFYVNRNAKIKDNIQAVHTKGDLNKLINYGDLEALTIKVKKLLVDVLLGFFPGTKWNGNHESNGTIVVKENGEQVGFHIIDMITLKNYLFEHIKFDTPSTSRHRFGSVIAEKGNNLYFKLNLQLRF